MPKLIRLYITQVLIGFAIAAAFVGALLAFNVANLWHLITHSDMGILAVVVLWVSNGIVFSGVQFAISVMGMADRDDDGDQGGKRDAVFDVPVRVKATQNARKRF
ncbi:hypothetical protein [Pacificibacter sp. AS14]|uniref:hypothetical protein n=1 Tax=Pacificibacter sp. AS14 TaxID=3135785 RepID=UPI00317C49AA